MRADRKVFREHPLVVGGIYKITAGLVKGIEQLEAAFLVHRTQAELRPLVANAGRTELDGRDMDTSGGRKLAVDTELGLGFRGWCEEAHGDYRRVVRRFWRMWATMGPFIWIPRCTRPRDGIGRGSWCLASRVRGGRYILYTRHPKLSGSRF